MSDDVFRSYFGHPILPCGFNADDNNGDEVDGAGTNWPIWPEYLDSFESLDILLITQVMLQLFGTECPDLVPACEDDTIVFPMETEVLTITQKVA